MCYLINNILLKRHNRINNSTVNSHNNIQNNIQNNNIQNITNHYQIISLGNENIPSLLTNQEKQEKELKLLEKEQENDLIEDEQTEEESSENEDDNEEDDDEDDEDYNQCEEDERDGNQFDCYSAKNGHYFFLSSFFFVITFSLEMKCRTTTRGAVRRLPNGLLTNKRQAAVYYDDPQVYLTTLIGNIGTSMPSFLQLSITPALSLVSLYSLSCKAHQSPWRRVHRREAPLPCL